MKLRKKKRRDLRDEDIMKPERSRSKKRHRLAAEEQESRSEKKRKKQKPLKFLLSVMNDPTVDQMERIKAALAALPYCHTPKAREGKGKVGRPRKDGSSGEQETDVRPRKLGKKETRQIEAVSAASSGRFRPLSPPSSSGMNGATH